MGVIQQGINQLIGTATIATKLAPGFETRQELQKIEKQETLLNKQKEIASSAVQDVKDKDLQKNLTDISERQMKLADRKFQLDPTEENFQTFVKSQKSYGQLRAEQKATEQLQQKRNFSDYLKKLETSFGGKVGDLPENLQKEIAKQYSKSQRQNIMNQMDKESKK